MKKQLAILLAAASLLSTLTACQRPSQPQSTAQTNQERILTAARPEADKAPSAALEIPERYSADFTGVDGLVTVHADAAVELPAGTRLPTATIHSRKFTQTDVDNLLAAFIGDRAFYKERLATKQTVQARIDEYKAMQRGEIPLDLDGDRTAEDLPDLIKRWEGYLKEVPDESEPYESASRTLEKIPFEGQYDPDVIAAPPQKEELSGWAETPAGSMYVFVQNWSETLIQTGKENHACLAYACLEGYGNSLAPNTVELEKPASSLTEAQAIAQADELMKKLGLDGVVCCQSTPVSFHDGYAVEKREDVEIVRPGAVQDSGFALEYVRQVDGTPMSNVSWTGAYLADGQDDVWHCERIQVCVSDKGVVYFRWSDPHTAPQVEDHAAKLLDFAQIRQIFEKMVLVKNEQMKAISAANGVTIRNRIDVDRVTLNLMRVRSRGNTDDAVVIPVWDFWATETWESEDDLAGAQPHQTIALTVNAIDGTIIDRELGY